MDQTYSLSLDCALNPFPKTSLNSDIDSLPGTVRSLTEVRSTKPTSILKESMAVLHWRHSLALNSEQCLEETAQLVHRIRLLWGFLWPKL